MKKLTIILITLITVSSLISCDSNDEIENYYDDDNNIDNTEGLTEWECGTHNGNTLFTGPRGGCYYYNSNGNKTYVERSECSC